MSVVPSPATTPGVRTAPDLEIVIPVYNEAEQLAASITALRTYLDTSFPLATITIADNASTDDTWRIATELAATTARRGRPPPRPEGPRSGPASGLVDQHGAGGRLHGRGPGHRPRRPPPPGGPAALGTQRPGHRHPAGPGAHVVRGARREFISRGYNLLLRTALRSPAPTPSAASRPCAATAAAELLPLVEDDEWFFDTEVLVTAQRLGLRIHEVPVDWVDDTDSRVDVLHTALDDLRGVWRMLGAATGARRSRRDPRPSMSRSRSDLVVSNATTGRPSAGREAGGRPNLTAVDTPDRRQPVHRVTPRSSPTSCSASPGWAPSAPLAYAAAFAALEPSLGGYLANAVAIISCSMGNTAAHRGMAGSARHRARPPPSDGHRGSPDRSEPGLHHGRAGRHPGRRIDVAGPRAVRGDRGNAGAAVIRFAILRTWVFRPQFGTHLATGSGASGTGADRAHRLHAWRPS